MKWLDEIRETIVEYMEYVTGAIYKDEVDIEHLVVEMEYMREAIKALEARVRRFINRRGEHYGTHYIRSKA